VPDLQTQVAIIGAGPAGLLLGHLLCQAGVKAVILERKAQAYVEGRVRAGILERTTTDLLDRLGLSARLRREGLVETGFNLTDGNRLIRIEVEELTGKQVVVYGQTEITRDLIAAAPERGLEIVWNASDVALHDLDTGKPWLSYTKEGEDLRVDCAFVAGCDGYHGVARQAIPRHGVQEYHRAYPFGWLGILADVPPCHHELIYSNHERGFALASMRSLHRSRYYLQVPVDEPIDAWPDDKIWDELSIRLGPETAAGINRGPAIEKSIAPLRSYVFEPMQYERLFLAGDSAHIVPPTGAKGLNLAASDVSYLAEALIEFHRNGEERALSNYAGRAIKRVWKAERFSWYLTNLMHRFPDTTPFERAMQLAELDYISTSRAMRTAIAENYVGLPLE
jgi:p-hydroxybenzoate 3-monooxygenase